VGVLGGARRHGAGECLYAGTLGNCAPLWRISRLARGNGVLGGGNGRAHGGVLGSIIAYVAGYYGGRPLILKYGRYLLISHRDVGRADRLFERYGTQIVFWARFLPIVRTFISLPAGIARMNFMRFLIYTILGSLPWTIVFTFGGMKLGENWFTLRSMLGEFHVAVALIIVLSLSLWLGMKVRALIRAR